MVSQWCDLDCDLLIAIRGCGRRGAEEEVSVFIRTRDSHPRSIAKAVSWRITGSVDTFLLSLLFTRSVSLAGSIALAEVVTKMLLYYLHERVWSAIRWNQRGQSSDGAG